MKLNTMQIFFGKKVVILHFEFWHQETKKPKRASSGSHEDNKFFILDEIKHDPKI
jgi:hypothetical protein